MTLINAFRPATFKAYSEYHFGGVISSFAYRGGYLGLAADLYYDDPIGSMQGYGLTLTCYSKGPPLVPEPRDECPNQWLSETWVLYEHKNPLRHLQGSLDLHELDPEWVRGEKLLWAFGHLYMKVVEQGDLPYWPILWKPEYTENLPPCVRWFEPHDYHSYPHLLCKDTQHEPR